jgi:hypothetical protein
MRPVWAASGGLSEICRKEGGREKGEEEKGKNEGREKGGRKGRGKERIKGGRGNESLDRSYHLLRSSVNFYDVWDSLLSLCDQVPVRGQC